MSPQVVTEALSALHRKPLRGPSVGSVQVPQPLRKDPRGRQKTAGDGALRERSRGIGLPGPRSPEVP